MTLPRHPLALAIGLGLPFAGQAMAADHRESQDETLDTMTVTTTTPPPDLDNSLVLGGTTHTR